VTAAHSYLSPTGLEIAFVLIGLIVLASGALVVTVQNLVHAALWLVVCLGAIAAEYLLLGAELVAWVQVLIYVGAVVVLLLFGLVLTKAPIGPTTELDVKYRLPALIVAGAAAGVLVTVLVDSYRVAWIDPNGAVGQGGAGGQGNAVGQGSAQAIGSSLFKYWVLPFETLSVLLLAALVGAIVLSRRDSSYDSEGDASSDVDADATSGSGSGSGVAVGAGPDHAPGPAPVSTPGGAAPAETIEAGA
jgi:NADH-quinone oxidoreductase subunit J